MASCAMFSHYYWHYEAHSGPCRHVIERVILGLCVCMTSTPIPATPVVVCSLMFVHGCGLVVLVKAFDLSC